MSLDRSYIIVKISLSVIISSFNNDIYIFFSSIFLAYRTMLTFIFYLQGVSAVKAFFELLSQSSLGVLHLDENKAVAPVELCPILRMLYSILIKRYSIFHPYTLMLVLNSMH